MHTTPTLFCFVTFSVLILLMWKVTMRQLYCIQITATLHRNTKWNRWMNTFTICNNKVQQRRIDIILCFQDTLLSLSLFPLEVRNAIIVFKVPWSPIQYLHQRTMTGNTCPILIDHHSDALNKPHMFCVSKISLLVCFFFFHSWQRSRFRSISETVSLSS